MGIHYNHFLDLVVDTLREMGTYSVESVLAICMIVAHESKGGKFLIQIGGGPALGVIQMEEITYNSIWDNADNISVNAKRCSITKNFKSLEWDLKHNIFMARQYLLMDKNPLPKIPQEMSRYLKRYYNTCEGDANPMSYFNDWKQWAGV